MPNKSLLPIIQKVRFFKATSKIKDSNSFQLSFNFPLQYFHYQYKLMFKQDL